MFEVIPDKNNKCYNNNKIISFIAIIYNPKQSPQEFENRIIKYITSLIDNIYVAKIIYPEWCVRVYIDHPDNEMYDETINIIPEILVNHMINIGAQIYRVRTNIMKGMQKKIWRYLPLSEKCIVLSRDIDSILTQKEADAVNEWCNDNSKKFHRMWDNPKFQGNVIDAGAFGGSSRCLPNALDKIKKFCICFKNKGVSSKLAYNNIKHDLLHWMTKQKDPGIMHRFNIDKKKESHKLFWIDELFLIIYLYPKMNEQNTMTHGIGSFYPISNNITECSIKVGRPYRTMQIKYYSLKASPNPVLRENNKRNHYNTLIGYSEYVSLGFPNITMYPEYEGYWKYTTTVLRDWPYSNYISYWKSHLDGKYTFRQHFQNFTDTSNPKHKTWFINELNKYYKQLTGLNTFDLDSPIPILDKSDATLSFGNSLSLKKMVELTISPKKEIYYNMRLLDRILLFQYNIDIKSYKKIKMMINKYLK